MNTYSGLYKTQRTAPNSFFIGANTKDGFRYADNLIFNENDFEMLYIIKGGPGTGKSTMMKMLRRHFTKEGCNITSYFCSSDPTSLDGIIIEKNGVKIGITDGTSPHALDANYPALKSRIINLVDYFDSDKLREKTDEIIRSSSKKALAFTVATSYIKSASEILEIQTKTAEKALVRSKVEKYIKSLISKLPKPDGKGKKELTYTYTLSMNGAFRLINFEYAKTVYNVREHYYLAPVFLKLLSDELIKKGYSHIISKSPFGEIKEIMLKNSSISFITDCTIADKTINLSRFADFDYFSKNKAKRHFNEKCLMTVTDAALSSLNDAKKHHFTLEEIYSSAVNFEKIDEVTKKLITEIEFFMR